MEGGTGVMDVEGGVGVTVAALEDTEGRTGVMSTAPEEDVEGGVGVTVAAPEDAERRMGETATAPEEDVEGGA